MRLWSLSPAYLDTPGLLAVWREGLLARAVLNGKTQGYLNHPQLTRFKEQADPLAAIDFYLEDIFKEATCRGYHFDSTKIVPGKQPPTIPLSEGQLEYELAHLRAKLEQRNPARGLLLPNFRDVRLHPLFFLVPGPKADWERG